MTSITKGENVSRRINLQYLNTTAGCQEDAYYLGESRCALRWPSRKPAGEVGERLPSPPNRVQAIKLSPALSLTHSLSTLSLRDCLLNPSLPVQKRGFCVGMHIILKNCFLKLFLITTEGLGAGEAWEGGLYILTIAPLAAYIYET